MEWRYLFIGLTLAAFVFLVIRDVVCWYWKINAMVDNLESIDSKLTMIIDLMEDNLEKRDT